MDMQFHPILYWACDYLCILGLKVIHVSDRGPWQSVIVNEVMYWVGVTEDMWPMTCSQFEPSVPPTYFVSDPDCLWTQITKRKFHIKFHVSQQGYSNMASDYWAAMPPVNKKPGMEKLLCYHRFWHGFFKNSRPHLDGFMQERRNSSALAMELWLSCTKSSIWSHQ